MDENKGGADPRDTRQELREQLQATGKAAGELLEQLTKIPAILAQVPLQMMPEDAGTHAQNAAREGFEAVRKLLDSMAKGIEQAMSQMSQNASTQTGVGSTPKENETYTNGNGATRRMDADSESNDDESTGGHNTEKLY